MFTHNGKYHVLLVDDPNIQTRPNDLNFCPTHQAERFVWKQQRVFHVLVSGR